MKYIWVVLTSSVDFLLQKLNKKFSSSSAATSLDGADEEMQGDQGWNDYSGYGSNSYGGGYQGNTVDDEDYSDDYSGSGSGAGYGGYNGKNPPYKSKYCHQQVKISNT